MRIYCVKSEGQILKLPCANIQPCIWGWRQPGMGATSRASPAIHPATGEVATHALTRSCVRVSAGVLEMSQWAPARSQPPSPCPHLPHLCYLPGHLITSMRPWKESTCHFCKVKPQRRLLTYTYVCIVLCDYSEKTLGKERERRHSLFVFSYVSCSGDGTLLSHWYDGN